MRDNTIDIGKFIAAILVVLIHTPIFDDMGSFLWQFEAILRLAVPFFIVCSGYYLGKRLQIETGKIAKTKFNNDACFSFGKKMCGIYIIWSIVYLAVLIPNWIQTGWFSIMAFVDWGIATILQGSYYHLWYVLYMIYAVVIFAIFLNRISIKNYPCIIIALYMVEIVQYGYRSFLPDFLQGIFAVFDILPCLSAVTRVLPLFMLGVYISHSRCAEENTRKYLIGFVLTFICLIIERNILVSFDCEQFSYIFFTLPVSYFLFKTLVSIRWKNERINTKKLSDISTYVYLIHPMYIVLLNCVFEGSEIVTALIVIVLSITSSYAIVQTKVAIKNRRHNNLC